MNPNPFGRLLTLILILDGALLLLTLGRATLARIDEGQIAEVSREMVTGHDWVTPRVGGVPWTAYPPLGYWLIGMTGSLLGFTEFTVRLPTALAAIALLVLVARITRRFSGPEAGVMAAMCLATLPSFYVQSCCCRADVITMCLATAALDRFLAWAEDGGKGRDLALMYGLASLGILAKGPLAVAILGLGGLSWFLRRQRWKLLLEMKLWLGIPAGVLIVLPWYWAVYRANGWAFLHDNLIMENWNAYSQGFQQKRPWYFYLKESPLLLPWLLSLPLSLRVRRSEGLDVALTWFGLVALFFISSSAKRINYLTYFGPPLAMAAGITLAALWAEAPELLQRSLWALGGGLILGAMVLVGAPSSIWVGGDVSKMLPLFPSIASGVVASSATIAALAWRRGPRVACFSVAAFLAAGYFVYGFFVNPYLNAENREAAEFCRRAVARVPAGETLYVPAPEGADGLMHFYAGTTMPLRRGDPGLYLASQTQRERFEKDGKRLEVIDSMLDPRGRSRYLLRILP